MARNVIDHNWIILIKIFILGCLSLSKLLFEEKFNRFIMLPIKQDFINIYKQQSKSESIIFNILMFFVHTLSLSLFVWHISKQTEIFIHNPSFIIIFSFITGAYFIIFILNLLVGFAFDNLKLINNFLFDNFFHKTYACIILYIFTLLFTENFHTSLFYIYLSCALALSIIVLGWSRFISFEKKNIIKGVSYYYILYFCTFEIAPLVIIYNLFIRI